MLDIKFIRENTEKVKKGVANKQLDPKIVDKVVDLDKKYRQLLAEVEKLRGDRNKFAKEKKVEEGKNVKKKLQVIEPKLEKAEKEFQKRLEEIPNLPLAEIPVGKSEKENVEARKWGEPWKFSFKPKDHLELGKSLGILDFEDGAKVSGSQFYFLYGDGALLELALIQFAIDLLSKEGFQPVITPDLAKSRYYLGTGYLPKGNEAQTYEIKKSDLGLIATAEVTLAGKHADEVIPEDKLPLKYIGYSHCFRQEAGSYGKYSKGLYRVHQFTKAEMFIYCKPEDSDKMHKFLLEMEEKIYQSLGLPYRI
ncbi:serine--tRNA ligase, partial [Candidatus Woesebacteria bacterium RBG_16_34_12]